MTDARKIQKLRILFDAVPEAVLRQLRLAMEFGADNDPDGLPYGAMIGLLEEAAETRGLTLTDPDFAAPDPAPEPVGEDRSHQENGAVAALADNEPLILEEAVKIVGDATTRAYEPPRNAMHAFFGPFEPLIIDPPKYQPRLDGYICSTSLPAIWRLLNEEASGSVIRDAWIKAEVLSEPGDEAFYRQITEQMHVAARGVLDDLTSRSREDPAIRRALISRLGSNPILGDLFEFQTLLPLGARLSEAFAKVKSLIVKFAEPDIKKIAAIITDEARLNPAMAGYLQLSVLSYMAEPWRALHLQEQLRGAKLSRGAESCLIADHLLALVTAQPEWLERLVLQGAFRPETSDALMAFSALVGGLCAEIETLSDNTLLKDRLQPVIVKGGEILARLFKHALTAIHEVLPLATGQDSTFEPDTAWIFREQERKALIDEALAAAAFLATAGSTAAALDQVQLYERAKQRAAEEIDGFADQLLKVIRGSAGDDRLKTVKMSVHVIALIGRLSGEQAGEQAQRLFDDAARAA